METFYIYIDLNGHNIIRFYPVFVTHFRYVIHKTQQLQ